MTRPLTIALHAELLMDGFVGGVEQFLMSLIAALGRLTDGPEQYVLVARPESQERLADAMAGNQRLLVRRRHHARRTIIPRSGRLAEIAAPWYLRLQYLLGGPAAFAPPDSGGFFESLGCDVVHFPFQYFERTRVPCIYNPHDLQHRHLPEFFSRAEIARRDSLHQTACRMATVVAAESFAARSDIIEQYALPAEKVLAILRGAPTLFYRNPVPDDLQQVRRHYGLPERFMFYPAQYWPHKNHVRLLQSLALLRERHGLGAHLVCTGRPAHDWPRVRQRTRELKLDHQVSFLGYVEARHLRALYRMADFVIMPTLFEGGGFPLLEAFQEGAPVACSSVTSLPEYGGDAVLLFDPMSLDAMAEAIRTLWCNPEVRESLRKRGTLRAQQFSWDQTARTYRALYRKVAGQELNADDADLLARSTANA